MLPLRLRCKEGRGSKTLRAIILVERTLLTDVSRARAGPQREQSGCPEVRCLNSARVREKTVFGPRQAKVFAQGSSLVFGSEQVAALEFRNHPIDEIIQALRDVREHDVEAIRCLPEKPFLHAVRDGLGRAHERQARIAPRLFGELPNGEVLRPCQFQDASASTLAGICLRNVRQGPSGSKPDTSVPSMPFSEPIPLS